MSWNDFLCRSAFMLIKAVTCKNPGYTRRMKPACGRGTWLMRFLANHSIGLLVANVFTPLGFTRQSTGPAMSVRLRGWAGSSSSAMMAVAASAATQGWHTATTWAPGPMACRNWIMCSM